jgi:hypothetical protein
VATSAPAVTTGLVAVLVVVAAGDNGTRIKAKAPIWGPLLVGASQSALNMPTT